MQAYVQKVQAAADFLRKYAEKDPKIGIITGTGLGESLASLQEEASFNYKEIPNFPESTVQSHDGRCVIGAIRGCPVAAMQGRLHLYEGYSPLEVSFPVRVMQEMGVVYLIVTNAAGGLNLEFEKGDIMVIADHINLTGENPLAGRNEEKWGERFPDMTAVYDRQLAGLARKAAQSHHILLQKGIYAGLKGPSMETPSETRYLRRIGADAVGFSTVMEVIAAVHGGMRVLGLSTITNINDPDQPAVHTVDAIIDVARQTAPKLSLIIETIIGNLIHDSNF
ncbi:MAG: purine-nucleoside phosphorylase [Desulfobacterales bacterium]|jgi:purine-nucleoside phosphorylase|nr:purine-nucleoside phosphorylase [Desulfobacterales bacterium]